ncbi:MAG: Rieske (2Fe-2S) protein [Pirellulales bacterium]|nr:Rieske (2Fe-2S) protein [Pirellulales bacterium]
MPEFIPIAKVSDVPEGRAKAFTIAGREIALFHVKGRFYALDDYCPHMGESLSIGEVYGDAVLCARHLWAFRLADGVCLDVPSLSAGTFEVRVEGDDVLVRIAEEA